MRPISGGSGRIVVVGGGSAFVFVKVHVTVSPSARPMVAVEPLTVVPPVSSSHARLVKSQPLVVSSATE